VKQVANKRRRNPRSHWRLAPTITRSRAPWVRADWRENWAARSARIRAAGAGPSQSITGDRNRRYATEMRLVSDRRSICVLHLMRERLRAIRCNFGLCRSFGKSSVVDRADPGVGGAPGWSGSNSSVIRQGRNSRHGGQRTNLFRGEGQVGGGQRQPVDGRWPTICACISPFDKS